MQANLKEITRQIESGMLLPALSGKIIQSMLDEDIDVGVLAKQITQEQSIVVRTLRVANSPFYGLSRQVDHLETAIIILGFRTIRNIAFGASLTHAFSLKPTAYFNPHEFWQHSIAVAVTAHHLALLKKENAEVAFTAGLLHNIGKLALARVFPDDFAQAFAFAQQNDVPLIQAENRILPFNHAILGAQLAKSWNLPDTFVRVIEFVNYPSDSPSADGLIDVVHIARAIASALGLGEKNAFVPPMDEQAWQRLNFDPAGLSDAFAHIIRDYTDLVLALLG